MTTRVLAQAAATDFISLNAAKTHLRVTHTADDAYIQTLIGAAVEYAEKFTGRALRTKTLAKALHYFPVYPSGIELSQPPLQDVLAITYFDTDGEAVELDAAEYFVNDYVTPSVILPTPEGCFPNTLTHPNAVVVEYKTGYNGALSGETHQPPESLKQGVLVLIGELYTVRADSILGISVQKIDLVRRLLHLHRVAYI